VMWIALLALWLTFGAVTIGIGYFLGRNDK
jgi:hypothetical protein